MSNARRTLQAKDLTAAARGLGL